MNKQELVKAASAKTELTQTQMEQALEAILETIVETIPNEKIMIKGFGTFESVKTKERTCRNPQDGSTIVVPEGRKPKWKPADKVKDAVKG